MAQTKKIVAIMFTSLVNYTKLTKQDPKLALELLELFITNVKLIMIIQRSFGTLFVESLFTAQGEI